MCPNSNGYVLHHGQWGHEPQEILLWKFWLENQLGKLIEGIAIVLKNMFKHHINFNYQMWKLGNDKTPTTYALHSQSSTYPIGKTYWKVKYP